MEKPTLKILSAGLKREYQLPEDLPFPLQKALQALAEIPADEGGERLPAAHGDCETSTTNAPLVRK